MRLGDAAVGTCRSWKTPQLEDAAFGGTPQRRHAANHIFWLSINYYRAIKAQKKQARTKYLVKIELQQKAAGGLTVMSQASTNKYNNRAATNSSIIFFSAG